MKLTLPFKDYIGLLLRKSNEVLTLNTLTLPFGLNADLTPSDSLLIGHVLDELAIQFKVEDEIDCFDVAEAALALGCEEAALFLEEAPVIIKEKLFNSLGGLDIH